MTDQASSTPLTDQTLRRLRALAKGNGIEPDSITLVQTDEQTYTLEATMTLVPFCDAETTRYAGPARGKDVQFMDSPEAVQAEVGRRKHALTQHPTWIDEVKQELQTAPGQGWGLDQAKVALNSQSATLAASGPCTQCHGNRLIACGACQGHGFEPCIQCRGQRQEICYNCAGGGLDPQNQSTPCLICRGTRYIPCRLCQATGQIACRTCGGRRGTPCPTCRGAGTVTEESRLTCGATTHFYLQGGALPSGVRRGLDRLGIVNLSKGHADIEMVTPKPVAPPEDEFPAEEGLSDSMKPEPKAPEPVLHYNARLPFADLRIDFGGKKAAIGAFGKRGVPIDVPAFLDGPLKVWCDKLKAAAQGKGSLDDAIKGRALHEALTLDLQGKGNVKEFRRLYPVGISPDMMQEIIQNMRKAIKRATLLTRTSMAVLGGLLSAGLFAACYFTSLLLQVAAGPPWIMMALDFLPPVVAAGAGWALLNAATSFMLRRRYPDMPVGMKQTAGKTGAIMAASIVVLWLVMLAVSPARPPWLPFIH